MRADSGKKTEIALRLLAILTRGLAAEDRSCTQMADVMGKSERSTLKMHISASRNNSIYKSFGMKFFPSLKNNTMVVKKVPYK